VVTSDAHALDAAAIAECATGRDDALERLYARHGAVCLSLARSILVDPHNAQDAVQEAFLHLWRHADTFDASLSTARGWLLRLTRCRAIDRVRAEERRRTFALSPEDDQVDTTAGPFDQAVTALLAAHAVGAIGTLSHVKREAIVLAYWRGYTQREIAAMTGAPLGTVKTRTLDALRELAAAFAAPTQDAHIPQPA
jgi:RNA polymerase sigma-70 factor (ECF subfamily)